MSLRILFILPNLEASAGGVADYVRLMGNELRQRGMECGYLSLSEGSQSALCDESLELALRIPDWKCADRSMIRNFVRQNHWDWISLQYVGYGFDQKGLPWALGNFLNYCVDKISKRHVMFHEIWTGSWTNAPLKLKIIGWFQKRCCNQVINKWRPDKIHTSNETYRSLLNKLHMEARLLPLFGNIPILHNPDKIESVHEKNAEVNRKKNIRFVLFGSVPPEWDPYPFLSLLLKLSQRQEWSVEIVSIGNNPTRAKKWYLAREQFRNTLTFVDYGVSSSMMVSEILQSADYGVALTPLQVIGKSGSAAAMLEHGLPIIVPRNEYYRFPSDQVNISDPWILPMDDNLVEKLIRGVPKREPRSRLNEVADLFIEDLSRARSF